jgi:hypothetical protein
MQKTGKLDISLSVRGPEPTGNGPGLCKSSRGSRRQALEASQVTEVYFTRLLMAPLRPSIGQELIEQLVA